MTAIKSLLPSVTIYQLSPVAISIENIISAIAAPPDRGSRGRRTIAVNPYAIFPIIIVININI